MTEGYFSFERAALSSLDELKQLPVRFNLFQMMLLHYRLVNGYCLIAGQLF
jgi:hypothetical protein